MEIINVSESYGGFRILFEDGTSTQCQSYGSCELIGFNSDFFVVEDSDYFVVLSPEGRTLGMIQKFYGAQAKVTSNLVVVRGGSNLMSYDAYGNHRGTRQIL